MKYLQIAATILVVVIFTMGCIKIDVNQKIKSDGNSEINMVYDMSSLVTTIMQMNSNNTTIQTDMQNNFTNACSNISANMSSEWTNVNCSTTSDYKMMISGEQSLKDNAAFQVTSSIPYITYKYDAKGVFGELSQTGGQNFSESQLSTMSTMASSVYKISYRVEMPGEVTKADVGTINGNVVDINVFDMIGKEHVYIESQELNVLGVVGIIIAVVVAVAVIAAVFILKRGGEEPEMPMGGQPIYPQSQQPRYPYPPQQQPGYPPQQQPGYPPQQQPGYPPQQQPRPPPQQYPYPPQYPQQYPPQYPSQRPPAY